jgi:hypothetical protein
MEFFINKNATLNVLKMELIQDGRNDFYRFYELVQNANIYFTMADVVTGVKRIAKKETTIELVIPQNNCVTDEYYLIYQFTERDTAVAGRYVGQFIIEFLDGSGTLIAPIREELFINVLEGSIRK